MKNSTMKLSVSTRAPRLKRRRVQYGSTRPLGVPWWGWLAGVGLGGVVIALMVQQKTAGRVFNRAKATGVEPKLLAFLDWWAVNGAFEITVVSGARTEEQQQVLYAQGRTTPGKIVTNARTAAETPHGRRAALDIYPVRNSALGRVLRIYTGDETSSADKQEALRRFTVLGTIAEAHGFDWGGRFKPLDPVTQLGWDLPHIEVRGWKSLPLVA